LYIYYIYVVAWTEAKDLNKINKQGYGLPRKGNGNTVNDMKKKKKNSPIKTSVLSVFLSET